MKRCSQIFIVLWSEVWLGFVSQSSYRSVLRFGLPEHVLCECDTIQVQFWDKEDQGYKLSKCSVHSWMSIYIFLSFCNIKAFSLWLDSAFVLKISFFAIDLDIICCSRVLRINNS